MKKIIMAFSFLLAGFCGYAQSGNLASGSNCTVPAGWSSCNASCWFSDCCIVFNPRTSEAGCGCWFGVALCSTGPIGSSFNATGTTGSEANIKFSFERFNELISYLKSIKAETAGISTSFGSFQAKYPGLTGKVSVSTSDYIDFQQRYQVLINGLSMDQKLSVSNFIKTKEDAVK